MHVHAPLYKYRCSFRKPHSFSLCIYPPSSHSLYTHRVLGTPTDATWPGVMELPDFKQTFPRWAPKPMVQVIPKLSSEGRDLLLVSFVVYSRSTRVKVLLPDAPLVQVVPFHLSCTGGTPRSYFTPTGVLTHTHLLFPSLISLLRCLLFLQQMLVYNPGKRMTAKAALRHPYFDDLDKSSLPASSP